MSASIVHSKSSISKKFAALSLWSYFLSLASSVPSREHLVRLELQ